ncbi:hypothetical protein [Arthrobacter sp. Y81]|uniref:hypothetical protein n=1 Tax=Arthrobacter sp. Y81 TaxID=2058897 RepID=UPI0011B0472C|nr:hypothetical protein [Arthrobacter sp. Y81]
MEFRHAQPAIPGNGIGQRNLAFMQGALYFPYIGVPRNAWWTRTLLYWDSVATITPASFVEEPGLHDHTTRELIRNELLYQVSPREAGPNFAEHFESFLSFRSPVELEKRQRDFRMGLLTRVHVDKLMVYELGFNSLVKHGLARLVSPQWAMVEVATAAEFMAALALSLCENAGSNARNPGGWNRGGLSQHERWVPVTDEPSLTRALLSGLKPLDREGEAGKVRLRVDGEMQLAEVRSVVLESVLPVPEHPMNVEDIVRFRRRHGDLLPRFRRDMERKVQNMADIVDPVRRLRAMDELEDEVRERVEQTSAYLRESPVRRVIRSPLVSIFKIVPGLKDPIEVGQGLLTGDQPNDAVVREPLAYLAFANAAFAPVQRYETDPFTGRPLLSAITGL